mmetsp:Transcript_65569/g.211511  ORF Transcript_65569/g.211511 Transcript_65569/m.211511 type:complete len:333 (+) Transcript_65569:110-1108(+)
MVTLGRVQGACHGATEWQARATEERAASQGPRNILFRGASLLGFNAELVLGVRRATPAQPWNSARSKPSWPLPVTNWHLPWRPLLRPRLPCLALCMPELCFEHLGLEDSHALPLACELSLQACCLRLTLRGEGPRVQEPPVQGLHQAAAQLVHGALQLALGDREQVPCALVEAADAPLQLLLCNVAEAQQLRARGPQLLVLGLELLLAGGDLLLGQRLPDPDLRSKRWAAELEEPSTLAAAPHDLVAGKDTGASQHADDVALDGARCGASGALLARRDHPVLDLHQLVDAVVVVQVTGVIAAEATSGQELDPRQADSQEVLDVGLILLALLP